MIKLIKFIIWIVGLLVVAHFALGYFGYEPNWNYVQESKVICKEKASRKLPPTKTKVNPLAPTTVEYIGGKIYTLKKKKWP